MEEAGEESLNKTVPALVDVLSSEFEKAVSISLLQKSKFFMRMCLGMLRG